MACNGNCGSCATGCHAPINVVPKLERFEYDFNQYSKPSVVFLGLTDRCNLACPYCFVTQGSHDMTLETAEKAIQIAKKNAEETKNPLQIVFFGGEPLLRWDEVIVPIVNKYYGMANFSITTNGVLLDEDKVDFLYQHGISPLLSFDGVKKVQDTQRPGKGFSSFDKIKQNIPYLLVRFPETTMRSTVTKDSIPYIYESFLMGVKLGFLSFAICPNAFESWGEEDKVLYKEQVQKVCEYIYANCFDYNKPVLKLTTVNTMLAEWNDIILHTPFFDNALIRCGTGTSTFSVTPDGRITTCQERLSVPTHVIGDVDNNINPEKHKEYLDWYWSNINKLSCDGKCTPQIRALCLSNVCPSRMEDVNFHITSSQCLSTQAMAEVCDKLWFLTHHTINPRVRMAFGVETEGEFLTNETD